MYGGSACATAPSVSASVPASTAAGVGAFAAIVADAEGAGSATFGCGRWFVREGLSAEAPGGGSPWQPLTQTPTPASPATSVKPTMLAKIVELVDCGVLEGAGGVATWRLAGGREFIGGRGRFWSGRGRSAGKLAIAEDEAASRSFLDGLSGLPTWSFMINPILCNSVAAPFLKGLCQSCQPA